MQQPINFDRVRRARLRDIPASSLIALCPALGPDFNVTRWESRRGRKLLVGDVDFKAPCGESLWPIRAESVKSVFPELDPDEVVCLCGHMVEVER